MSPFSPQQSPPTAVDKIARRKLVQDAVGLTCGMNITVPIATADIVCIVTTAVVCIFPVATASVLWTLRSQFGIQTKTFRAELELGTLFVGFCLAAVTTYYKIK